MEHTKGKGNRKAEPTIKDKTITDKRRDEHKRNDNRKTKQ